MAQKRRHPLEKTRRWYPFEAHPPHLSLSVLSGFFLFFFLLFCFFSFCFALRLDFLFFFFWFFWFVPVAWLSGLDLVCFFNLPPPSRCLQLGHSAPVAVQHM